ncbi:MAG: hypothetical protein ACRBB5_08210 [Nitrosopumilus sp.]
MDKLLFMIPALLLAFAVPFANAESHDNVTTTILEFDGVSASIQMTWDSDDVPVTYEVGCVSCTPNTSELLSENTLMLEGITPFPNTSNAMLYLISYDSQNEITHATQIIVNLE